MAKQTQASAWVSQEYREFNEGIESVFLYPVGFSHSTQRFHLWKPGVQPARIWKDFWSEERQERCKLNITYPYDLLWEEWRDACKGVVKNPAKKQDTQDLLPDFYQLQFSRSVAKGRVPREVINELHSLVWKAINDFDFGPTPHFHAAKEALLAVIAKADFEDRISDPYEDYPAIKKLLGEDD